MQFLISFIEGIITFISPCLFPMLPIYISYFAGGGDRSTGKTLKCAFGFVTGFTIIFTILGALAGSIGGFLSEYRTLVNIVTGLIVVLFGLGYLEVFRFSIFRNRGFYANTNRLGFFSSVLFGMTFSIGWTPCVGAFLGSALMLASQHGNMIYGIIMLLLYSLGLGIPFILSAVLIDTLKSAIGFIKRNYGVINKISGAFLVIMGILMMTGVLEGLMYG